MATHGTASRVVVSGKRLLNPFRTFLHRVSSEILEEDLKSLKFILADEIPEGILENCQKSTDLFSYMIKKCLIGENDLDFLAELFHCINRSDLAERVKVFISKSPSSLGMGSAPIAQVTRELPAMGKAMVRFMLSGNNIDQRATLQQLKIGICAALRIKNSDINFVKTEEEANNSACFTFQIPKNDGLLNSLRNDALQKEDWLCQCGIQAVRVGGDASYICLVQPLTHPPKDTQARLSQLLQAESGADLKWKDFVNKDNLDLIVVVERTKNRKFHTRLKTQLAHLVEMICVRDYNFRLALVCYQDHTFPVSNAITWWFTKEKDVMKSHIHYLNESRIPCSENGLADGLALVQDLATKEDSKSCRKDANRVCILLPSVNERTSLETYKCSHGHDVMKICRQLAENSVTLYTVGIMQPTTASPFGRNPLPEFFSGISLKTGGRYIQTQNIKQLPVIIMCAIKEDLSLERLIGTAHDIVLPHVIEKYGDINVEELTKMLREELNRRSCLAKGIVLQNSVSVLHESELARKLSYDEDLESACCTFREGVKRLQQAEMPTNGLPQDVDMEKVTSDLARITISKDQEITDDLSERLVRKVGHRAFYCTSS